MRLVKRLQRNRQNVQVALVVVSELPFCFSIVAAIVVVGGADFKCVLLEGLVSCAGIGRRVVNAARIVTPSNICPAVDEWVCVCRITALQPGIRCFVISPELRVHETAIRADRRKRCLLEFTLGARVGYVCWSARLSHSSVVAVVVHITTPAVPAGYSFLRQSDECHDHDDEEGIDFCPSRCCSKSQHYRN